MKSINENRSQSCLFTIGKPMFSCCLYMWRFETKKAKQRSEQRLVLGRTLPVEEVRYVEEK